MIKILFILTSFLVLPLLLGCHGQYAGLLCSSHHKIWRMGHSKESILSMAAQNVYFYSLLCGSAHFNLFLIILSLVLFSAPDGRE